jgi:RimJ/RimL family protein N-acetyltransferase
MIFETERLIVRRLLFKDLNAFHRLESNPLVLKYATGNVKSLSDHREELKELISKYDKPKNNFFIYAIQRKSDDQFIGTVALVKDNLDDEIGYRFIEEFWKLGYGFEVCKGLVSFCKHLKMTKIIAYVVDENKASAIILEKNNFIVVDQFINDEKQPETKYRLKL